MSSIEYSALLHRTVSRGINWSTDGETLLLLCRGLIAAGSENNIQNAASLFKELEKQNNLGIDHLDTLIEILRGMQKWPLIDEVEKFQVRRENYVSLKEKIICKLDEYDVRRLIELCGRQHLATDREDDINDVGALFKELENKNCLGADCLRIFKKILKETGEEDLLKEVENFERKKKEEDQADRQRMESEMRRAQAVAVLSSAKIAGEKLLGIITPHCTFRNVAGGVVVVTTWMILKRSSNLEEFVNAFTEAVLPLGNTLRAISEGSVCFTIQAENRSALEALWERYQNGTLQKYLQEFLVTEEITQLANGEEVTVTVEIDEQEYKKARSDLTVTETQGLQEVELGTKSKFSFVTRDLEGQKSYNADDQVTVKIQDPTGNFLKKKIEDSVDGTYAVSFTPNTVGPHSVLITVNRQPLTGSPWSVQVSPHQYKHVFTFGTSGGGQGQFNLPHGISINDNNDHIAVADSGNNRIQIFSADGSYLGEFGQKGSKAERLRDPRSVAFNRSGDLIVFQPDKISLFSESGQFIKHVANTNLKVPMSLSLTPDGNMVACDWSDMTIKVLSPDGTQLLQSFTAPNCNESLYSAVYHQDMFIASYHGAHCVKVFNKEGLFLYGFGSEGSGDGQLSWPRGIAIDKFNNLIVCDSDNNRLQVFRLGGRLVNMIKEQITELGSPYAISVSNTGQVFVTDVTTNCVHVFQ